MHVLCIANSTIDRGAAGDGCNIATPKSIRVVWCPLLPKVLSRLCKAVVMTG